MLAKLYSRYSVRLICLTFLRFFPSFINVTNFPYETKVNILHRSFYTPSWTGEIFFSQISIKFPIGFAIREWLKFLPDVFSIFYKEASVSHSQHCKKHSQAEIVHETKVLFDVTTWSIANVESCVMIFQYFTLIAFVTNSPW